MKETTRQQLSLLQERYPNATLISLTEAAKFIGVRRETLERDMTFPIKQIGKTKTGHRYVNIVMLAEWLTANG